MKYILALFVVICLTGCISSTIKDTNTGKKEAIIFGKITIKDYKAQEDKQLKATFYGGKNGAVLINADIDSMGYFHVKVPTGELSLYGFEQVKGINRHETYAFFFNVSTEDEVKSDIANAGEIYYLGDIDIKYVFSEKADLEALKFYSIYGGSKKKTQFVPVKAEMNPETITYFTQKFADNKKSIVIRLLK